MRNQCAIALLVVLAGCDSAPPAPGQHAPFLIDSTPPEGEIITEPSGSHLEIMAVFGDENLTDQLFMRFLVDYPGADTSRARLALAISLPPSGLVTRSAIRVRPDCATFRIGSGLHRLMLSVSDRRFLDPMEGDDVDPNAPLDSVPQDAHRLRTVWLLNCP
jgi:hypothetical protein